MYIRVRSVLDGCPVFKCYQFAPFSLHEVVQVVVVPFMQSLQTATH
jgi:hypothetical protein